MKIKEFIIRKFVRGRKPWSITTDILFFVLILMFLIPSTRGVLLSGVAAVRTVLAGSGASGSKGETPGPENWNWKLTGPQGEDLTFASLKGEVIFLNQWATWCPPCRAEMPSIEKLFLDYGDRVRFVMLTSEDPQKVQEYTRKHGYTFPVYFGQVAGPALSTRSIPSTVVISRSGEILIQKNGAFNWNARKIRKLLDRALSTI